jgi:hypothetical protein
VLTLLLLCLLRQQTAHPREESSLEACFDSWHRKLLRSLT